MSKSKGNTKIKILHEGKNKTLRSIHVSLDNVDTVIEGGPDSSMLAAAGELDSADETFREYERVVDLKYLDQIRAEARQFSNKRLSRQSGVARSAIMNFKKGRNTIKPRTLRNLTKAIHALQNRKVTGERM